MTFIVKYAGMVFQKDLGRDKENIAEEMTSFNRDESWRRSK